MKTRKGELIDSCCTASH